MALAHRATFSDVEALCAYLLTKPTGATTNEARAVLDAGILDPRKITAIKTWNLIDDTTGKMRLTERGRGVAKDKGAHKTKYLREVLSEVPAYMAIIERAVHRSEFSVPATDVSAHWHQHFRSEASENDDILNQQAICFFQIAEGADLGRLVIGRRGQPTRFEFDEATTRGFVEATDTSVETEDIASKRGEAEITPSTLPPVSPGPSPGANNRVFITHGKNRKIMEQIKRAVVLGGFEPVVSVQQETAAKPVPQKVMDDMRSCFAAVIHVGAESELTDKDGQGHRQINPNVLIEIGAAMIHCRERFILVVEDGLELPSNLQGLYQCRYSGEGLDWDAGMKILEALRGLK